MIRGVNISKYVVNSGGFLSEYFLSIIFQDRKMKKFLKDIEDEIKRKTHEIRRDYNRKIQKLGSESDGKEVYRVLVSRVLNWLGYDRIFRDTVRDEKDRHIGNFYKYSEGGKVLMLIYVLPFEEDIESGRNSGYKRLKRALFATNIKWGMVTNGRIFRLVKNEALGNAYLDINLYRAWEDDNRDVFELFTLLFSKDSLLPKYNGKSILNIIEERCKEEASSVGEELRDTVYQAVETLLREIHRRKSDVDLKELFEETLIYMFRLLFLFYAESTELLPVDNEIYKKGYSITNLRELILEDKIKKDDEKYFIWETLNAAFRIINHGVENTALRVEPYNGGLFDFEKTPIISGIKLPDSVMVDIIRDISLTPVKKGKTRDRVSFRELGISQLGSIYESLLELEPKVAEEDLAVVKIKGEERYVPISQVEGEAEVKIKKGEAYLSFWGGTRKSTGTYYTPRQITEFLVRSALEEQVRDKKPEEILKIKIVDPAMGSGAFLVAAVNFLGDAYYDAVIKMNEEKKDELSEEEKDALRREGLWFLDMDVEEAKRIARRRVLENCIYGVDINPLAVDLAKVSLWLTAMEKNKPLTFLDHKLRCGNSLIGTTKERIASYPVEVVNLPHLKEKAKNDPELKKRLQKIKNMAKSTRSTLMFLGMPDVGVIVNPLLSKIEDIVRYREKLMTPEEEIGDIKVKEEKWQKFVSGEIEEGKEYEKLRKIYDLWTALWFWEWEDLPDPVEYARIVGKIIEEKEFDDREKSIMERVAQLRDKYHFFHWELEFPEVFERGGFDAAVGNPPWDIVKPNSDEFFSNYDPKFREYKKQEKNRIMKELMEREEKIRKEWDEYVLRIGVTSFFVRNSGFYPHQYRGDINLYKLFLERFFWVIRDGGWMSIIVPSGLYTDEGCKELRRMFLERSRIRFLIGIENREKIFPAIDIRFKYTLFSTLKEAQEEDYKFRAGFFVGSRPKEKKREILDAREVLAGSFAPKAEELENLLPLVLERGLEISRKLIERFSPDTLSIMEFKRQEDIDLAEKIYDDWPLLGDEIEGTWNVKFTTEFHMTNDSHLFVTRDDLIKAGAKPLDSRELRWHLENDAVVDGRELKAGTYLPLYEGKMIWQFDAFYERPRYWINLNEVLRRFSEKNIPKFPRSIYRAIASNTNERTLISCMLPSFSKISPGCGHSLNSITQYTEDISDHFLFNSVFSSYVVDFVTRQKVTTNLTMFYLYQLPIPRLTAGNWFFDQIVPRAARLICIDEEFAELWEETFRPEWREIAKTSRVGGWEDLTEKWTPKCGVYGWYINKEGEKRDDGDRAQLRAEIDALVAHLYGLTKEEFAYILDTFPVLRRKEEQMFGEYRTKRMCLEEYDRFARIIDKEKIFNPKAFNLDKYKKFPVEEATDGMSA